MWKFTKFNFYFLILSGTGFFYSCKGIKPALVPAAVEVPALFHADSSGQSIGTLKIRSFFKDSVLTNLIESAIQNNPDVLIASQRIEMARAYYLQSRGALLPFFSADATAGVAKFGDYTMNGVGNFDTNLSNNLDNSQKIPSPTPDYLLGINSAWEIDVWGKLRSRKRAGYSRMLATERGRHFVITSLVATVAELYYTLLILDQELLIVRNNIALQQKAVETISFLKEGGRTNELAVKQSSAQLLHTRALEYFVIQNIISTENQLNSLLVRYPQPIPRKTQTEDGFSQIPVYTGIPSEMLLRRPDIRQAELELRASEMEVKSARAAFLPSLTISAFGGYNSFNASLLTNPASLAYGLFAGLSAPIFQGNRIRANYRNTVAQNYEAYYNYQKTIYRGYYEVQTNLVRIGNYKNIVELKKQEVETLHGAVLSSDQLFKAGYANYLEVITAQRNVLEAEIGLIDAQKEQYISQIHLYRALGGGWDQN